MTQEFAIDIALGTEHQSLLGELQLMQGEHDDD
jgi:hypothetical protein